MIPPWPYSVCVRPSMYSSTGMSYTTISEYTAYRVVSPVTLYSVRGSVYVWSEFHPMNTHPSFSAVKDARSAYSPYATLSLDSGLVTVPPLAS